MVSFGSVQTNGYNADGLRAKKTVSSGRTYYLYDGDQVVGEFASGNSYLSALNTWGANGLLARHTQAGSWYYTFDMLGNVAQKLNSAGTVLSSSTFDPAGNQATNDTNPDPYSGFGGQWGYVSDYETGLTLLGHRFYDSGTQRFLTRDPISYDGGINLYAYVGNNPVNDTDPDGFFGQASTDNPDGAIVARQCTEETGSSGLGKPGRIFPPIPPNLFCRLFPWLCPKNTAKGGPNRKPPRTTGHRQTGDVPSWVPAARQRVGLRGTKSCAQYVAELLDEQYGGRGWYTGRKDTRQGSEYSQIVKDCENNPGRYP